MNVEAAAPRRIKIRLNPAINSKEAVRTLVFVLELILSSSFSSARESPEMYDKYAGIRGKTHGLKNVIIPAKKLTRYGTLVKAAKRASLISVLQLMTTEMSVI